MGRITLQETFDSFYLSWLKNPNRPYSRKGDRCMYYFNEDFGCAIGQVLIEKGEQELAITLDIQHGGYSTEFSSCWQSNTAMDIQMQRLFTEDPDELYALSVLQGIHDKAARNRSEWYLLKYDLIKFTKRFRKFQLTIPTLEPDDVK